MSIFALDKSGKSNHWTANNLVTSDVTLDSPTNNFATFNPLIIYYPSYNSIFSEGNLKGGHDDNGCVFGSIVMTTGKWYAEMYFQDDAVDHNMAAVFAVDTATSKSNSTIERGISYKDTGDKVVDGTTTSYGATYSTGDIIGIAVDVDAGNVTFYKNNASQGSTSLGAGDDHVFACGGWNGTWYWVANFGQDSSFAGNKTAQGETDSNGIGDFYYEPPADFLALCTSNLPDPAVTPSENFNTVTYTGNGSGSGQAITVGFKPDLTWLKIRSGSNNHALQDSVRGTSKTLFADVTNGESNYGTDLFSSFDTNGFTLGTGGYGLSNDSGSTYVGWNWKGGNAISGTGDFTQGTRPSTCSRNVDAGFSIVSYSGDGTGNFTVGHGLSSAPDAVFVKRRDSTSNWYVWHKDLTSGSYVIYLNATNAQASESTVWNGVKPTSDVFTIGTDGNLKTTGTYIAYCFHSVEGFSKCGKYVGNNTSGGGVDGAFIYTGFRPSVILTKCVSSSGVWMIHDNKRNTYNPVDIHVRPNTSGADDGPSVNESFDFLSNGFKARGSAVHNSNSDGETYIYLAFAETPFKQSNAR